MNAVVETRSPVAAPHATSTFKLLLKREFWEHKGGFFWAPLVAGAIGLLMTIMAIAVGEVAMRRAARSGELHIEGVQVNGLDLGMLTQKLKPEDMQHVAGGVDLSLFMSASWPLIALAFVVFFYCLGALYDERKDRSVLFWKSLPLSDRDTVLSKAASALLVAPALALLAAVATMLGFMLVLTVVVLLHGGDPVQLLWGPGSPLSVMSQFLAALPVYALWALPTVGWLLLVPAGARSKPILWALMIPLFAGLFVSWFDLMQVFDLETTWFWKNIVARLLTSVFPGSWMDVAQFEHIDVDGPAAFRNLISLKAMYSTLLTPQLWLGAAAGAAMIFGAIRLRRWRDEG